MVDQRQEGSPRRDVDPSTTHAGGSDAAELVRQIQARADSERRTRPDRRASERRRARMWTGFLVLAAVFAVLVTLPQFMIGYQGTELDLPPDELMGTWSTDDPRYIGRTITITPAELRLGLGAAGETVHSIRSIRAEAGAVHREYQITYAGPEGDQVVDVFVYDDGLLRLRNPSEVRWTRARD